MVRRPRPGREGEFRRSGERVQVRAGSCRWCSTSRVEAPIRSIHVAGTLEFDPDRDTLLTVGLIKVQAGDDLDESGLDVHGGMAGVQVDGRDARRPALLVGTARRPIAAGRSAVIRLADRRRARPGGLPGDPLPRGADGVPRRPGEPHLDQARRDRRGRLGFDSVVLDRPTEGWRVGDRVIVTSTRHQFHRNELLTPKVRQAPQTEERTIRGDRRASPDAGRAARERRTLANPAPSGVRSRCSAGTSWSSRPIPAGVRGHTMYHRDSLRVDLVRGVPPPGEAR